MGRYFLPIFCKILSIILLQNLVYKKLFLKRFSCLFLHRLVPHILIDSGRSGGFCLDSPCLHPTRVNKSVCTTI